MTTLAPATISSPARGAATSAGLAATLANMLLMARSLVQLRPAGKPLALARHAPVGRDPVHGSEVPRIGSPAVHVDGARRHQVEPVEEAGDLLAGAQRLRGGDALVVDALRVGLGVVDVDRGCPGRAPPRSRAHHRPVGSGRHGGAKPRN
jgi:hypothetical protein